MKPAIFYTIHKDYRRFRILTVTSEKQSGRFVARYGSSRVYGRDDNGWPTNASTRECYGRFEEYASAKLAMDQLVAITEKHKIPINEASAALAKANLAEKDEIDRMLAKVRGEDAAPCE